MFESFEIMYFLCTFFAVNKNKNREEVNIFGKKRESLMNLGLLPTWGLFQNNLLSNNGLALTTGNYGFDNNTAPTASDPLNKFSTGSEASHFTNHRGNCHAATPAETCTMPDTHNRTHGLNRCGVLVNAATHQP